MVREEEVFKKYYKGNPIKLQLNIVGYDLIPFDIYDGYATCQDFNGKRFDMTYPQLKIVRESKELADEIMTKCPKITRKEEITIINILMTYNTLYVDGVEVIVD